MGFFFSGAPAEGQDQLGSSAGDRSPPRAPVEEDDRRRSEPLAHASLFRRTLAAKPRSLASFNPAHASVQEGEKGPRAKIPLKYLSCGCRGGDGRVLEEQGSESITSSVAG